MKKLCKNCESFAVEEDGKKKCSFLGVDRDDFSIPPPESSCWKKRKKLSGDELSLVRSKAGKKGGSKSGYGNGGTPTQQTCIRKMDHDVLKGYAAMKKISIAETVHRVCKSLTVQYPNLKTDLWRD